MVEIIRLATLMAMRRDGTRGGRPAALVMAIIAAAGVAVLPATAATAASAVSATTIAPQTTDSTAGLTGTPLLSVRRVPDWVAQTVAAQRLAPTLSAILAQPALGLAARTSCVVATQGGLTLFSDHPLESLIPASNMKLLTATALLDRLGPTYHLTTTVVGARPVGGSVRGDLYLVGGGDPLLRTSGYASALGPDQTIYTSLNQLAEQVRDAGVTAVTGSVVGDETRYDQLRTVPTWKPVYAEEGDVGPLSALEVNDGSAPATTSQSGSGASAAALQAATSADPAVRAAVTFTNLLRDDGVRVSGRPASGKAAAGLPTVTSIASPTLAAEVDAMLTVSDDTAAELFTKELGYRTAGAGTTAAGVTAIRADLAADGLPVSQLVAEDGSGLDRGDRVTCNLLHADLEHEGASGVLARGLPVAGETGTLRLRMRGTPAAGRVRAKTGTLDDVVALSGFVTPKPGAAPPGTVLGQPIVFAVIFDGVASQDAGRAVADEIGTALASYPQLPSLAGLGPQP
jgi:D-alanyl-D-alanine carboxypeptidase/D-alanyl-D-alanine-endopeptidase (penicillin-binding protein 4)